MVEAPVQETYVFPSTEAEARRLELQGSKLYGGVSFLDSFLASAPRDVLDVGCGSGYFTRHVAGALPSASVMGMDIDEARIAYARSQSAEKNVQFCLGDMASMPFAKDSFDLAFCRFALVHSPNTAGVLREMSRVAKPGGSVVAYDMIHEGIWFVPDRPAFASVLGKVVRLLREGGAEPNQGLFLTMGMRHAGLIDISTRVIAHHALAADDIYEACRDNWMATLKHLGERLGPLLDAEELRSAIRELERVSGDELLVETTVLAWGTKP
jgi:ubiquinone/menaquinone biosynthesis C-methylase UbiE